MRALTNREWITVGVGGGVVALLLIWTQLISPGTERLEKNARSVAEVKDYLAKANDKINQRKKLLTEYKNLTDSYSNALETITPQKMPDNLARTLREEFGKLDAKYQSTITSTAVKQPQTNDMYSFLGYQLKDVKCDWKSLNAALGLIENAGQLVGFDSMKIRSNLKDPASAKAVVDLSVESFTFNETEDMEMKPWAAPDYDKLTENLRQDIFSLPADLVPIATKGGKSSKTTMSADGKEELPAWTKYIQLTGISSLTKGGPPFAIFMNRSARSTASMKEGEKIFDTEATVTYINPVNAYVEVEDGAKTYTLRLRSYGDISDFLNKPFSFQPPADADIVIPGADTNAVETAAGEETQAAPAQEAPAQAAVNTEATVVPEEYDKPLGSSTECMMGSGIYVVKVDASTQRRNRNVKSSYGMLVHMVQKMGPGENAGLQSGDVILEVGGLKVDSPSTFTYAMNKAYGENTTITLKYKRKDEIREAAVAISPKQK